VVANLELRCIAAKFGKDMTLRDNVVQLHPHPTHKTHKKKSNVAFDASCIAPKRNSLQELGSYVVIFVAIKEMISWWRPSCKEVEDCARK
jgi:hypothetical protein